MINRSENNNNESATGYRAVLKATSIFGGVQIFNIILSLVRGKILAVLIGTAGMGLNGLLISSLTLITKASSLGLNESAVRDISSANHSKDTRKISYIYTVFKHWIWLTAILGVILTLTFAPLLSKIAFDDTSHTKYFILLASTFIFSALTGGVYTLLRGLRKIKDLARANISGSVAGLLIAIPFFYFFGIDGVVPAIIGSSIATFLVSIYFNRKVKIKREVLSIKETFRGGRQMVNLGLILTISSLLDAGVKFFLSAYISKTGGLDDLGIYNAGYSIMAGYVGMVFTAMGTDYFPRLSEVIDNPDKWKVIVNQQAETVLLILGPILTFILLSSPILIKILLSSEFLPSLGYLIWASTSILLRGIIWTSGFIIIAKGDKKIYLFTEIAAQIYLLSFNLLLYKLYGTDGLGMAMTISYIVAAIVIYYVLKLRYNFVMSKATYQLLWKFLVLIISTVLIIVIFDYPFAYYVGGFTFIISLVISIKGLILRIDLMQMIKNFRSRKKQ